MACGDLKDSGLPSSKFLREPEPVKTETLARPSLTGTLVTMGPTLSTPALTTEPRKTKPKTTARRRTKTRSPRIILIFFISPSEIPFGGRVSGGVISAMEIQEG